MKPWHVFLRALLGLIVLGTGLAVWAVVIEPGWVRYKDHSIYLKNWPAELSGYSIAFITDPHVGGPHITLDKMREIVAETNALKPDLVLLGGDYVIQGLLGGTPVPSGEIAAVLGKLVGRDGVYGILGNHDRWENALRMEREFDDQGIPMLENKASFVTAGASGFWLAGVSDYSENAHDVGKAMAAVPSGAPVIVLTHSPDVFPELPDSVGLTLAGHTHGGQVYIPFFGRPVVPSKYGQRYALGLVEEAGRQIFIGQGIGTSILPIRFMTPPEVSLLRIYRAQ